MILQSLSNFLKETFNQIETDGIENNNSNGQISLDTNNFIKGFFEKIRKGL